MHVHPVARAWAEALLEIARERNSMDEIGSVLLELADWVEQHDDIRVFLETPALEAEVKTRVLERSLRGAVDDVVLDFICLLVDKERIGALRSIAEAYRMLADEAANRQRVFASTATPMSPDQRQRLVGLLDERLQSECILEATERPELLGGLVLSVGDTIYDGSVRAQLQRFRNELMRSSGYED
ncbi:MAG: ATP synthase F1 subunit delta [Candidatus Latescibacterota bacterium]|nr:MAG: ATP synthase F1 subunit delta [Candidatus Latescibacterota bacterium]